MVRQRQSRTSKPDAPPQPSPPTKMPEPDADGGLRVGGPEARSVRSQWILYAMASGACAAFNGVFAKLTTTGLTSTISDKIANAFGLSEYESVVEIVVRGMFFALNLTFNGVMWTLFTTALARGTSTTQVSILNTSTNFLFTAIMGLLIFSESLPPMWWVGAGFLVAGSVIVGRKDETEDAQRGGEYAPVPGREAEAEPLRKDDEDEDVIDLGDLSEVRDR